MISIVIPVYNAEKYIEKTIDSCLNQTYKDIEIIVVDDCSSDNSVQVIKDKMTTTNRISLFINERNQGVIKTINYGIKKAKGEYVMPLGNDDILRDRHVEVFMNKVKEREYSFLYCSSDLINEEGDVFGERIFEDVQGKYWKFARKNPINACGTMINRIALEKVGFYPELYKNCGEWYLWIELIGVEDCSYIQDIKSKYRIHSTNLTKKLYSKDNIKATREYSSLCMKKALTLPGVTFVDRLVFSSFRLLYVVKMIIKEMMIKEKKH